MRSAPAVRRRVRGPLVPDFGGGHFARDKETGRGQFCRGATGMAPSPRRRWRVVPACDHRKSRNPGQIRPLDPPKLVPSVPSREALTWRPWSRLSEPLDHRRPGQARATIPQRMNCRSREDAMRCDMCGLETKCPVTVEAVPATARASWAATVCPACLNYRTLRALSAYDARRRAELKPVA